MTSPRQIEQDFLRQAAKNEQSYFRRINKAARTAAKNVMNDLAERGPEYSGIFKDSWRARVIETGQQRDGEYPYSILDVPKLVPDKATAFDIRVRGIPKLEIYNTQPYQEYALDLKRGKFRPDMFSNGQPIPPIGRVRKQGGRGKDPVFRGEFVNSIGTGKSTARPNWFRTYIKGAKLRSAIEKGVRLGFTE
tara:strand:+ start:408 stop:983 length:576 start_codon:yes stop_codon:yes gene_type:complete